ncbi:unnamed protein product [Phytophthora fragariaefolia]|uniref:Unnamed protein product n=1 Tax=Phytophthora fragariaefolia TaxID=1490495 RepID=A0A9W7D1C5_9STRA|nr:unnamed protein product [Phytophthora fragariaefolia]
MGSPATSPIGIIIKKNGVDIRLCIVYRLVNSLARLMVYPMPLINDLLEDLDKELWYCSLDMASGVRVIYQRLVDNALYGHLKISANSDSALPIDVFKDGEPETDQGPSVLARRSRFIEDFAIYAAVLYELREADFHEIRVKEEIKPVSDPQVIGDGRSTVLDDGGGERTMIAFTMLKAMIASTPILRHFDPDCAPVVVVYASKWAISASLMQEHDGVCWPVMFTSRTLKSNDINYGIVDKEVLALLRILDV